MSSSQPVLAYRFHDPQRQELLDLRLRHAGRHLADLFRTELAMTAVGDGRSGLVAWTPADRAMSWRAVVAGEGGATVWIHVPSAAGGDEEEVGLADRLLAGSLTASDLAAPFGLLRWSAGRLDILNDALGLVRLFHLPFADGEVWTTRPGLAHVFMGVPPAPNEAAWSGMSTVGWAPGGATQLGVGRHLSPASHVTATAAGTTTVDGFTPWFTAARCTPISVEDVVRDMRTVMRTARRWPAEPVADLSGGMDSRTVAAVGLTSGAVRQFHTVATDHGEVATAQRLVELAGPGVGHTISRPAESRAAPAVDFRERLAAQHRAWEGRYLATSGFNASAFAGFRTARSARFNGLGGEFLGGGNFADGAWRGRLGDAGPERALDRLAALARGGVGSSRHAAESTMATLERVIPRAERLGLDNALGVLDLCYMVERMPYWSNTYATGDTLTPLFAARLLSVGVRNAGAPVPAGQIHRDIIRTALPAWADVPFYSPERRNRAVPHLWETAEWPAVKAFIGGRESPNFAPDAVAGVVADADDGVGGKAQEFLLHRLLWELTFRDWVGEVRGAALAVSQGLGAVS